MRRLLVVPLLFLALVGLLLAPSYAAPGRPGEPATPKLPDAAAARASKALDDARGALHGKGPMKGQATLALMDLRESYDSLSPAEKRDADALMARPTDGTNDPQGDGYSKAEAKALCGGHFCIHYIKNADGSGDSPPNADSDGDGYWNAVEATYSVMSSVWNYEVGSLGYRAPATDGTRGGGTRFDVYLKDLRPQGLYGYCVPEATISGYKYRAYGYCVLDEDFANYQLSADYSRKVTAAHEFFHAIQFNYDYAEDRWLKEATATWMEERAYDAVNDNRQYLASGQMKRNFVPLDTFEKNGFAQYGNWSFFELLSQAYGTGAIKELWNRMDSTYPTRDQYSTQSIVNYLASKGTSFKKFYSWYAGANMIPRRAYSEGSAGAYPAPTFQGTYTLSQSAPRTGSKADWLHHMSNKNYRFKPGSALSGTGSWRIKLSINGPSAAVAPGAYVVVRKKDGTVSLLNANLNKYGDVTLYLPFTYGQVTAVDLSLVNASTTFKNCWVYSTAYSCSGVPVYNGQKYYFSGTLLR